MSRKSYGSCTYCKRQLTSPFVRSDTAMTKDHVMPRSVGGVRKVKCCRQCNQLKGDIHPSVWRWFTENFPRWWKSFRTNHEVALACRPRWGSMVSCKATGRAPRWDFEQREAPLPHAAE